MKRFLVLVCALLMIPMLAMAAGLSDEMAIASPETWASPVLTTGAPVFSFAALSVCTASCDDGTTRTCSGSQCSAQDSSCSPETQGSCWSDAEGYKYCPAPICPTTCRSPSCDDLNGQFCKVGGTCFALIGGTCRQLSCGCFENQYVCP